MPVNVPFGGKEHLVDAKDAVILKTLRLSVCN